MFWLKNWELSSQFVRLGAGQGPAWQLMSPGVWSDTITVLTIRPGLARSLDQYDHCYATGGASCCCHQTEARTVPLYEHGSKLGLNQLYNWGAECCQVCGAVSEGGEERPHIVSWSWSWSWSWLKQIILTKHPAQPPAGIHFSSDIYNRWNYVLIIFIFLSDLQRGSQLQLLFHYN